MAQKRFATQDVLEMIQKQHNLRKKFIDYQGENTHEYMGVELLSYKNNETVANKAAKQLAQFVNSFFLPTNAPGKHHSIKIYFFSQFFG